MNSYTREERLREWCAALDRATEQALDIRFPDRRDRIATACMTGLLAADFDRSVAEHAKDAVDYADALIAELDKPKKVKKVKKGAAVSENISHWLETAYSRICAGEAEANVLRDYGLMREEAFTIGVEHLRQENDRLKVERDEAVKAEREECAKLCDQEVGELAYGNDDWYIAKTLAAAIRARGEV